MNDLLKTRPRVLALLALLALAALLPGCGKNGASQMLVPTGIRPAPTDSSGVVFGYVRFDSVVYAGLTGAPYPPTVIELLHNGEVVATDHAGGDRCEFRFSRLPSGQYSVRARAHGFRVPAPITLTLIEGIRDAGDLFLPEQSDSLNVIPYVVGTMPGFSLDDAMFTSANVTASPQLGVWSYPDFQIADYTPINAGTYRFKFCTDINSSTPTNVIGWGGDASVTLTAPITLQPARYGSSPAEDIRVTIPTSGNWQFIFDERRLTFSITPAPPSAAVAARARTPR